MSSDQIFGRHQIKRHPQHAEGGTPPSRMRLNPDYVLCVIEPPRVDPDVVRRSFYQKYPNGGRGPNGTH